MEPEPQIQVKEEEDFETLLLLQKKPDGSEVTISKENKTNEILVRKSLGKMGNNNEANICEKLKEKRIPKDRRSPLKYLVEIKDVYTLKNEDVKSEESVITMPFYDNTIHSNLEGKFFIDQIPYELVNTLMSLMIATTACRIVEIIHGDLKPQNIFVQIKNSVRSIKLGDFGSSYSSQNPKRSLGTDLFMSPQMSIEKFSNGKIKRTEHEELSDIFSLGVILAMIYNSSAEKPVSYLFLSELDQKFKQSDVPRKKNNQPDEKYIKTQNEIMLKYYEAMIGHSESQRLAYLIRPNYEDPKKHKIMNMMKQIIQRLIEGNYKNRITVFELYELIMENENNKSIIYSAFTGNEKEKELIADFENAFEIEKEMKKEFENEQNTYKKKELAKYRLYKNLQSSEIHNIREPLIETIEELEPVKLSPAEENKEDEEEQNNEESAWRLRKPVFSTPQ